jgi:putative DNA primase/helicase
MSAPMVALDLDYVDDAASRFRAACHPNLIRQSGNWYDYSGTHYKQVESSTITSAVQKYMSSAFVGLLAKDRQTIFAPKTDGKETPLPFGPRHVQAVVAALAALPEVHKPADTYRSPSWLDGRDTDPKILPCKNGLLDIRTRELLPHTPEFFCTYCLPHNYNPAAPVPRIWLRTLLQIFAGRKHLVRAFQEAFGYTITGDRRHEKIFYNRGVKRGGKGTTQDVLQALIGRPNYQTFTFSGGGGGLGEGFGLANAEDKQVLCVRDWSRSRHADISVATTRLKMISGNDPVPIRKMHTAPYDALLPGQWWINSNIALNFGGDADAINGRLLGFPFDVSFIRVDDPDHPQNPNLKTILTRPEILTGILNWALAGYDRLEARGSFEEWPESAEIRRDILRQSDPLVGFIELECETKADAFVEKTVLYECYSDWCAENDRDVKPIQWFGSNFAETMGNIGAKLGERRDYSSNPAKSRPWDWRHIRLSAANRIKYYEHDPDLLDNLDLCPDGVPNLDTIATEKNGRPIPRGTLSEFREDPAQAAEDLEPGDGGRPKARPSYAYKREESSWLRK